MLLPPSLPANFPPQTSRPLPNRPQYVLNDGLDDRLVHNRRVRIYERLVRRILAQPRAPAVVLVQVGAHGMFRDREELNSEGKAEWRPFHHTPEDLYGAVAQYYGLSAVSYRGAIYRLGQARRGDFSKYMKSDRIHPNDSGHKVMADMIVHLLQEAAVGLALWPLAPQDEETALGRLPEPMYPGAAL